MGCGCQGSGTPRVRPAQRDRRVQAPPPRSADGEVKGAVGSKNYYYEGPVTAPKPEG